jgi:ABC-type cobalamin/Fe3+-siderophores transport system ATPase subunit
MFSAYSGPILELNDVSFGYPGGGPVVRGLSCSVREREIIGLLGANGSGKSTMLKLAAGMLRPAAGALSLWNKPLASYRNRDRAKLLCYFPQHLDVTVPFTVREIVGMGLYPYDIPPAMTVDEAMEMVGVADKADSTVTTLSGGERRRVFLAMTLIQGAGILLLDEPLANLDIRYQIEFLKLIRTLRDTRGIAVLMALHDINLALQFEKVIVIKDGSVLSAGAPDNVLTAEMIRRAFDVTIQIRKAEHGSYIIHEKWL